MRIAIGSDHVGLTRKGALIAALEGDGHVVLDLGAFSPEPVDYPDYARVVGQAVLRGFVEAGMLVCGSEAGAAMAANKVRGVRAAPCADIVAARESREQLDANVLCLSARSLDDGGAVEVALAWVNAGFSGDETYARHVAKLSQLDAGAIPEREPARPVAATSAPKSAPRDPGTAVSPVNPSAEPTDEPAAERLAEPVAVTSAIPDVETPVPVLEPAMATAAARTVTARAIRNALDLPAVEETLAFLESQDFLDRLWVKDASLWRGDAGGVRNRLGWLTSPTVMRGNIDELRTFADEIRRLQFSQVVLLGVGGSSLAGRVMGTMFPSKMGFPDLFVLDSSDPAAVKQTLDSITLGRALFVVSTKSGASAETLAMYAYFRGRVESTAPKAGMQFVAITDPGTPLERLATEAGFRRTFLNAPSIGGRYSALSFFGLVPAALTGVDVRTLLERAQTMVERCGDGGGVGDNPGARLGAVLAALCQAGRDKVTLVLSEPLKALGRWIEQLLAESLGKDGKGLVPVVDEPLGTPVVYGDDRVFVAVTLEGDTSDDAAL